MSATGGSIISVTIRGRIFAVAADADATLDLGGWIVDNQANGDGNSRVIKTRKPWMIEGLVLQNNSDLLDLEFLQEIANTGEHETITIDLASGHTYQGKGIVTGEIKASTQNATVPVAISGKGELTQQ